MWDAFMDPTLKAPFVQGPRERCPGPTRQEPFVAYCSFSLRSPPPGSPTWSYRKLWSYRCPQPFTLCRSDANWVLASGGVCIRPYLYYFYQNFFIFFRAPMYREELMHFVFKWRTRSVSCLGGARARTHSDLTATVP